MLITLNSNSVNKTYNRIPRRDLKETIRNNGLVPSHADLGSAKMKNLWQKYFNHSFIIIIIFEIYPVKWPNQDNKNYLLNFIYIVNPKGPFWARKTMNTLQNIFI